MNRIAKNCLHHNKGFTLVELMIGIVVSIIVLAGVTQIFVGTIKSSGETLKAAKLNQDLQAIMNIMTAEIRRAGHWESSAAAPTDTNPFTTSEDINTATNGCILYTYDSNSSGGTVPETGERFGFKLDGNGDVFMKTGHTAASTDCSVGTWVIANSDGIETITTLTFTPSYKCTNATQSTVDTETCATNLLASAVSGDTLVETRRIDIVMEGQLDSDSAVTKRIEASVRVRNDRIFTQP